MGIRCVDYQNKGSLFTLFLTSPVFAFCFVCHLNEFTSEQWNHCHEYVKKILTEITKLFLKSKLVGKRTNASSCFSLHVFLIPTDSTIYHFFADEFLRLFLARFVFCYAVLRLHRAFKVLFLDILSIDDILGLLGIGFLPIISTSTLQ